MTKKKVVVAMSGGVDSSVAAAILKEQGYEVMGVTMNLFSLAKDRCKSENLRSCCGWMAVEDAHRVSAILGISHYVADLREDFERKVIADFCKEYSQGRTPNPCIRCNQFIKFENLMERTRKLKADYLATGHHARVLYDSESERYLLKKGKDKQKDQSYFTQKQLSWTLMPIGHYTKEEVRQMAQKFSLPVSQRPESQEICFVPDRDYAEFLRKRVPEALRPGPIVDLENRVLGQHKGIAYYTIGQRRGMGISAPHPLYVIKIQPDKNTVVVGPNEKLYKRRLKASQVHFISLKRPERILAVKAKIRYKHQEAKAILTPLNSGRAEVEFEKPQRAITPGQSVVFYDGDVVIGGGVIDKALD